MMPAMSEETTDDTHLTVEERTLVEQMIKELTLLGAAKELRVAMQTLRAVRGGLAGQRGTISLVRDGLTAFQKKIARRKPKHA